MNALRLKIYLEEEILNARIETLENLRAEEKEIKSRIKKLKEEIKILEKNAKKITKKEWRKELGDE